MDKANWSPDEAVQLARELNNYGTHYRNAVASLYNTFSLELSNYWRGKNYNVVAEYFNEHYDEFNTITNSMCITIPSAIQNIAALQAEDGLGAVSVFSYEINDPTGVDSAIGFNLIPMTEESADGSIILTEDVVRKYIDGNSEPSLIYYQEKMEEYMNSYSNVLNQFSSIKEFNDALKSAYEAIDTFKVFSNNAVKNIIEETKLRADAELGKISETDINTKDLAVTVLTGTSSSTPSSSSSTTSSSTTSTNTSTETPKTSSNFSSSNAKSENTNSKSEFIGPLHNTMGPSQEGKNKQVVEDYLASNYEKGENDMHEYTLNGEKMYIDNVTDNGDSYTVTGYSKDVLENDPYNSEEVINVKK